MFARLKGLAIGLVQKAKSFISPYFDPIARYLLGDLYDFSIPELDGQVYRRASHDQTGIGILRLGPAFYPHHLVVVMPKRELASQQLKILMNLTEPQARSPYKIYARMTKSAFFLGMNDAHGRGLRRKFVSYLDRNALVREAQQSISTLLRIFENYSVEDKNRLLEIHARGIFSRTLFGFELTTEMANALKVTLKTDLQVFLPDFFMRASPQFDLQIKHFLSQYMNSIRDHVDLNDSEYDKNFFISIIKERYPALTRLRDMTQEQLNLLLEDEEMRLCVTGMLAIDNLITALKWAITALYGIDGDKRPYQLLSTELFRYIDDETELDCTSLMDKKRFPVLHAFYLETLRFRVPMPDVVRYTHEGINEACLSIPPRSLIVFSLIFMVHQCATDHYPASDFRPERFLNAEGELNHHAHLNQDILAPFGLGKAICPAVNVSEYIIKLHIAAFARHIKQLDEKNRMKELSCGEPVLRERTQVNVSLVNHAATLFTDRQSTMNERITHTETMTTDVGILRSNLR